MKNSKLLSLWICVFFIAKIFALSNLTNYQSVLKVNDIAVTGTKIWAASSGGLYCVELNKPTGALFSDIYRFPDLELTALTFDSKGDLWIGSKQGYLYKMRPDGYCSIYDSYYSSQWDISDISSYRDYIIVASSKGFSIFDPRQGIALRNASIADTFGMVNAIGIHNDSLYLGCDKSMVTAFINGNKFLQNNYLDLSIWKETKTDQPIVSFINAGADFIPLQSPAAYIHPLFFNSKITNDTSWVYSSSDTILKITGRVTRMISDDKRNIWIGTDQHFFYCRNEAGQIQQYTIAGLWNNSVNRVYSAQNGMVWLLPEVADISWWEGITGFDGKNWQLYNKITVPQFGNLSGAKSDFRGVCEDKNGNMWFGTSGAGMKFFDVKANQWYLYDMAGLYIPDTVYQVTNFNRWLWGKHDAIAIDSSGYMWISTFIHNDAIKSGMLVCYDYLGRETPNYRRFFPSGSEHHANNIVSLCVDSKGVILAGTDNNTLLIITHNTRPIKDGITVEKDIPDITIKDMFSTQNGKTWLATSKGLFHYNSSTATLSSIAAITTPITSVVAENEQFLWIGTYSDGLIRYDIAKETNTAINVSNGLVSNSINNLCIDKKAGYLWIGTDNGLSRYSLGHTDVPIRGNASIVAYPNPFSLSNPNHREVVFKHCAPDTRLCIYAMNGRLIKQLTREYNNAYRFDDNADESTLSWIPSKKTAPGAYYFVGQSQKPVTMKKLFIVP